MIGVEGGHGFCALICEFERSRNHLLMWLSSSSQILSDQHTLKLGDSSERYVGREQI